MIKEILVLLVKKVIQENKVQQEKLDPQEKSDL